MPYIDPTRIGTTFDVILCLVCGTRETTFKAEWHQLKWPFAARPPGWKHSCTNCFTP